MPICKIRNRECDCGEHPLKEGCVRRLEGGTCTPEKKEKEQLIIIAKSQIGTNSGKNVLGRVIVALFGSAW